MTKINVYKKIFEVQQECNAVAKGKKGGLKYEPLAHESVTGVVREALKEQKLIIIPQVQSNEQAGNQTRCTMSAEIVDIETGESVEVGGFIGYGNDSTDKGPGAAMSYAYKYLLLKVFMLPIADSNDSELGKNQLIETQDKPQAPKTITTEQASEIKNLIKESNQDVEKLLGWANNAPSVDEMPAEFYDKVVQTLKERVAK